MKKVTLEKCFVLRSIVIGNYSEGGSSLRDIVFEHVGKNNAAKPVH